MKLVVAVILNYNSAKDTKKCIEFLKKQDYKNFKILVVDNCSTEKEQLESLKIFCREQGVDILLSDKNGGFSAGNNIGIKRAMELQASWILIINPDVEIRDSSYISYMINESAKWEKIGAAGSKVLLPNGENQNPMRELTAWEEILFSIEIIRKRLGKANPYKTAEITGICEKVSGCCFLLNCDFLRENGLLDENIFMYCEEPILAKSLIRAGYRALYINEVTVYHQHFSNEKSENRSRRMIRFLSSRKYYIRKYSEYGFVLKNIAVLARNMQILFWRMKQ